MAKKIASLYAEIGADTTKFQKGLQQTKTGLQGLKASTEAVGKPFKDIGALIGNLAVVAGPAIAAGYALKKAYDVGKEGAQLEFTARKFDRLTASIGSASDALLGDLKRATSGTVSDMQLMGSAADFMSLGLAKTHEQVVRLTSVAGKLGMDMNQLVLTLTNQTTMRFDALGVSVDGFDAKVKALKETGMNANAAFTEAFLQQAEAQIAKVGDIAETGAGQIAIMEASVKNLGDSFKMALAPAVIGASGELAWLINDTRDIVDWSNVQVKQVGRTTRAYFEYGGQLRDVTAEYYAYGRAIREAKIAEMLGTDEGKFKALRGAIQEATNEMLTGEPVLYSWTYVFRDLDKEASRASTAVNRAADAFDHSGDEAAKNKQKVVDFLGILDADVGSPIASFIEDLNWIMAGGGRINAAFEALKEGLASGKITPAEAEQWASELYVATTDIQLELNQITAKEAAQNLQDTLGKKAASIAMNEIKGTQGIMGALQAIQDTEWNINFKFNYSGTVPPGFGGPGPSPTLPGGGNYRPSPGVGGPGGIPGVEPGDISSWNVAPSGNMAGNSLSSNSSAADSGGNMYVDIVINATAGQDPNMIANLAVAKIGKAMRAQSSGGIYRG